jgi:hypothetical protein
MHRTLLHAAILAAGIAASASVAVATPQICEYRVPEQWRPKAEIEALAQEIGQKDGFKSFFVQPDGGCWGIYARTSDGARIEILLDPMTKAVVRQGRS